MDDLKQQQVEALQVMVDYIPKLRKGIETVSAELSGNRQPDTDTYLNKVIEGLNWVINVYNGTASLIAEKDNSIDKTSLNEASIEFSQAIKANDTRRMVRLFNDDFLPFINSFEVIAKSFI